MEYRRLGNTDKKVSVVAMGCWALAGDAAWGPQDDSDSIATVHAALDTGINCFDTAEAYGDGRSETVLGKALRGHRQQAIIATKASATHLSSEELQQACERSLRRLSIETIDLYQVHWPSRSVPLVETVGALERLQSQGKVRAIGVCNFGVGDFSDLLAVSGCETNQLPYSLLWRGIEYGIKEQCEDSGVGILCYSPLAQGLLTGKFGTADEVPAGRARTRHFSKGRQLTRHGEEGCESETFDTIARFRDICSGIGVPMAEAALAWVLQQSGVTSVLAGARRPEQIRQNARASALKLDSDVISKLSQASEVLKTVLDRNLDQYQSDSRMRYQLSSSWQARD